MFLWLALAAPAAGFGLAFAIQYSPPVVGLQAWPALTLLLGAIGGVSVFGGKQRESTGRVLGQQRLSPGVVWVVKVSLHLGLVAIVVVPLLLGALPALDFWGAALWWSQVHLSYLHDVEPVLLVGPYIALFVVQGFGAGCLCGLLFSKTIVAGFVALLGAALLSLLWLPSLLAGSLCAWQYLGVPVLLVLTTRLLVWRWTAGQLGSAAAVTRVLGGVAPPPGKEPKP